MNSWKAGDRAKEAAHFFEYLKERPLTTDPSTHHLNYRSDVNAVISLKSLTVVHKVLENGAPDVLLFVTCVHHVTLDDRYLKKDTRTCHSLKTFETNGMNNDCLHRVVLI